MAELSQMRDVRFTGEVNLASVDDITYPSAKMPGSALKSDAGILKSQRAQQALAVVRTLPLDNFRVTGTGALLGTSAGTPSGAMGLTYGTHGTNSPKLVGESASGNSKTNTARVNADLGALYDTGETVVLRVRARITTDANTAQTIDAEVYKPDGESGVGSDLVTTGVQNLTDAWADYDFTINPASLDAGDPLDIELTAVANDTGGSAGAVIEIGRVQLLADIR